MNPKEIYEHLARYLQENPQNIVPDRQARTSSQLPSGRNIELSARESTLEEQAELLTTAALANGGKRLTFFDASADKLDKAAAIAFELGAREVITVVNPDFPTLTATIDDPRCQRQLNA
jgi:cytosine/adenosine deaminase-related metal-dependent hydrolase